MKLEKSFEGFMELEFKALQDKQIEDQIVISGIASHQHTVDRDGDVVIASGIILDDYKKNPILLYNHDMDKPIGKVTDIIQTKEGLKVEAVIYKDINPHVFNAVKSGVLKSFSIGFRGIEGEYDESQDAFIFTKVLLFEISVVSIPTNQNALFDVVQTCENGQCSLAKKGLKIENTKAIKNNKVSMTKWSDVDKTKLKDEVKQKGAAYIKEAFLVVPDVELKSTWKFPHHEMQGNDLVLNRDGVIAAWAALNGARNRPTISPEQKLQAAKHLLKHYKVLKKDELVGEIPQGLLDMVKELEVEVTKMYEEEKALTPTIDKIVEENKGNKLGDPIKDGKPGEIFVNATDKSVLGVYPNPPMGYVVRRFIKGAKDIPTFVLGKSEVAKLLNLMNTVFKDRDENGREKDILPEETKSINPIDVFKEIWSDNPDNALKAYAEVEKFLNAEVAKMLADEQPKQGEE